LREDGMVPNVKDLLVRTDCARLSRLGSAAALVSLLAACGGESEPEPARSEPTSGAERVAPREGGMQVRGLMGTIPERKVHAALDPRLGQMQRCFLRGAQRVEFIGGGMEFYFRVGGDGRVEWIVPRASSVGDRATERCLLDVVRTVRFPSPQGGDAAEIAWSFEIDVAEDVRPPVSWDAAFVAPVLAEQRAALTDCGLARGALNVTAYVSPGGTVLSAGAAAETPEAAQHIDCAVAAIETWSLPDPGSYAAKVSFAAP
jgi:hypothetical protein